uniref:Uncharacterized protein n=1 Tax=Pithovirus LCPAC201 TaxID=2506591 RepID=A0A481Z8J7_9VIRU|nr:MAG: hypothetical protein LCPAC201_02920 [Pithovirus LCPAC201]
MNPTQTQTQLPADQLVIFTPHNEQLKKDLLSRKVNNVVVSTIGANDEITDLIYQDFIFHDDTIQARAEKTPLYWFVSFMAGPEVETIGDIFKCYDGEIYHTIDQLDVLNKTRSQLAEICGKDGKDTKSVGKITVVTAFNSKDNKCSTKYISLYYNMDDNTKSIVKYITFPISHTEKHYHRINFAIPVTERQAIEAAERFLSKSLDEKYYDMIADDLDGKHLSWIKAMKQYKYRGDCISDQKFNGCVWISGIRNGNLDINW